MWWGGQINEVPPWCGPAQRGHPGSQSPAPTPMHAAEFCQHEAESRAELEQQSRQDIIIAEKESTRAWVDEKRGGPLKTDCTHSPPPPSLVTCTPGLSSLLEKSQGVGVGELPGAEGGDCATTCPPTPSSLPGFAYRLPNGSSLGKSCARSSSNAGAGAPSERGRGDVGGASLLRKQPGEGILGARHAPSRVLGTGPRAARMTAALPSLPSLANTSTASSALLPLGFPLPPGLGTPPPHFLTLNDRERKSELCIPPAWIAGGAGRWCQGASLFESPPYPFTPATAWEGPCNV